MKARSVCVGAYCIRPVFIGCIQYTPTSHTPAPRRGAVTNINYLVWHNIQKSSFSSSVDRTRKT